MVLGLDILAESAKIVSLVFVMLAMFPRSALILFVALVFFGMIQGWVIDKVMARAGIRPCVECDTPSIHPAESGIRHYLQEHVWRHIVRKHIGKTAMWTVMAVATGLLVGGVLYSFGF